LANNKHRKINRKLRKVKKPLFLFIIVIMLAAGLYMLYKTKTQKNKKVIIGFAGDTMLGRLVNKKIGQAGYTYPLGNLIPLLEKTDGFVSILCLASQDKSIVFVTTKEKLRDLYQRFKEVEVLKPNIISITRENDEIKIEGKNQDLPKNLS